MQVNGWFQRFKNDDFDISNKECPGQPKKFEDAELEQALKENSCQTQDELAELFIVDRTIIYKC